MSTKELKRSEKGKKTKSGLSYKEILDDYYLAFLSRQLSIIGRKEVLSGNAKFGIFGDGKEVAQIAYAKNFVNGDWRSGYYRDQTFLLASGLTTADEFFYQLYGDIRLENNPHSGGRSFNNHFSTRSLTQNGSWKDLTIQKNCAADLSPTAAQMPRMLGLGLASKFYRNNPDFSKIKGMSVNGNEVVFVTIGDASTSEGLFFESMNAAGVLQIPVAIAVWDDGYGISVSKEKQTIKSSISEVLKGFEKEDNTNGIKIYKGKGWDYEGMVELFKEGIDFCRKNHVPVLFHIEEVTQPQGHSTSGSHERYKTKERLKWENDFDALVKLKEWILENNIADTDTILEIEKEAIKEARESRSRVWKNFNAPLIKEKKELISIIKNKECSCQEVNEKNINKILKQLTNISHPIRKDLISTAKKISRNICITCTGNQILTKRLQAWLNKNYLLYTENYSDCLYNESKYSTLNIKGNLPIYSENSPIVNGREILNENFDRLLEKHPNLVAFGEDLGKIGGVNQCFEGLQEKYGEMRVFDTGIREASIIGKGIGLAMRGFRPIAEIQYFDYLLYALQGLSDDLATLHWRTKAGQSAPLIVRTRGHRLEGIWHAGSPMSMVLGALRGMYICTPRNMTQAAGMYNTLLEGQDPALIVEPLNAYRYKERRPDNLDGYKVALGVPEKITEGNDITIITYGSCVKIALEAVKQLQSFNIHAELLDVQTLIPFDLHHVAKASITKTGKVLFFDEDVPGGGTGYMLQKVLVEQQCYQHLKHAPLTLSAKDHRPAYGSDGDYFSKPSAENVFEKIYNLFYSIDDSKYPTLNSL